MTISPPAAPNGDIKGHHDQNVGYALAHLHRLFHDRLSEALADTGLHLGHVLVLATLRARRELNGESTLTQTQLAQITGIEKSSLVLFLDALERDGWVERRRHPRDRRAHIIHLTADGAKRFELVGRDLHIRERQMLSPLSAAEEASMLAMIQRLIAHLS